MTTLKDGAGGAAAIPGVEAHPSTAQMRAIVTGEQLPDFRRTIGGTDLRVFPLALNANLFGWRVDVPTAEQVLDAYWLNGGNLIDTADCYAGGRSEIMIGSWMASRRNRDSMVIATKVGKGADFPGVTARAITAAVNDSLARLRTDRIDLLSLHVDDPEVPFEETLAAIDELVRAGKVRYFGTTHHSANRLYEARVAAAQLGLARLATVQFPYNLVHRRDYERGLARTLRELDLTLMPRFGLAGGFLTGKYRTKASVAASEFPSEVLPLVSRAGLKVLGVVERIAAEHGVPMAVVAVAWLLTRERVVAPIVSATSAAQVHELAIAHELSLTRHQIAELDRISSGF